MGPETQKALRRFGSRIRQLRESRGMTQEELAERCGLSQKFVSQLERGAKTPSFETILVLSRQGFGLRASRVLEGVDPDVADQATEIDASLDDVPERFAKAITRAVAILANAARHR